MLLCCVALCELGCVTAVAIASFSGMSSIGVGSRINYSCSLSLMRLNNITYILTGSVFMKHDILQQPCSARNPPVIILAAAAAYSLF